MLWQQVPSNSRAKTMSVRWSSVHGQHGLPTKSKAVERFNIHGDIFILQYSEQITALAGELRQ